MPVLPRIDELLEAVINGYEDVIRRSCDVQRTLARSVPFEHSELEPGSHEVFVARRSEAGHRGF